jgi:superfamily II DNA or RNA helicase
MSFKSLNLPRSIRTSISNPTDTFFVPVFKRAVKYDVAVAYFSSQWVKDAAEGVADFASRGGISRWIVSPNLTKEDFESINSLKKKGKPYDNILNESVENLFLNLKVDVKNTIAWLIEDGVLEFKIAVPKNDLSGIFHAKIGVFEDGNGDRIAFSGSYNLTGAANSNWEKIDIYKSWNEDRDRVDDAILEFDEMWDGLDPNLDTYKPSQVLINFIKSEKLTNRPYDIKILSEGKMDLIELRPYQQDAINSWRKNKGRGIYEMATGTGKTITALATINDVLKYFENKNTPIFILIVVPYIHLVDQWEKESRLFNFEAIKCYDSFRSWSSKIDKALIDLDIGIKNSVIAITTIRTFEGKNLQYFIKNKINHGFMIVVDEAHNIGSNNARSKLPDNAQLRLGLTATPNRYMDEEGTKAIFDYFGNSVINFGLKEAIENKFLTRYFYYPIVCELTESEFYDYEAISREIAKLYAMNSNPKENVSLENALRKRTKILSLASNKLISFYEVYKKNMPSKHNLVYCSEFKNDKDERHIDIVSKQLGIEFDEDIKQFTSEENSEERKQILNDFSLKKLTTIVAMRCLDEGVDVPKTRTAYILASSKNSRQFIQRRGRVLRKADGKDYAYIYDFVVVPPVFDSFQSLNFELERKLLKNELLRVKEFAKLSENYAYSLKAFSELSKRYDLEEW